MKKNRILIITLVEKEDWGSLLGEAFSRLDAEVEYTYLPRRRLNKMTNIEKRIYKLIRGNKFINKYLRKKAEMQIVEKAKAGNYDLAVIMDLREISCETVTKLRNITTTIGWFPDAIISFTSHLIKLLECIDYIMIKDPIYIESFKKIGVENLMMVHQCADRDIHKNIESEKKHDIVVFGDFYEYRDLFYKNFIDFIIEKNYSFQIFGYGWHNCSDERIKRFVTNRIIVGEEKKKIINETKVVINEQHFAEIRGLNKRFFEVSALGTFQLIGITETNDVLKDIHPYCSKQVFTTIEEFKEKLTYYLEPQNETEREEIAKVISEEIHKSHTYDNRALQIKRELGL